MEAKKPDRTSSYIVGAGYDYLFFIASPILACILAYFCKDLFRSQSGTVNLWGHSASLSALLALTQAHLVLVFFRSHGNPNIFRQYRWRFVVVPPILLLAIYLNTTLFLFAGTLVTWWDVYHTSQQNYGLARIYDAKCNNIHHDGKLFEKILHLFIYAWPLVAGSYFALHLQSLSSLKPTFLGAKAIALKAWLLNNKTLINSLLFNLFVMFMIFYLIYEFMRYQKGYRYNLNKILLILSTSIASYYAWTYHRFVDGYFIVNFFHAVQYFAIVWAIEGKSKGSLLAAIKTNLPLQWSLLTFLMLPILYGSSSEFLRAQHFSASLLFTVALLHFWYDGFIWSVSKKQIATV